MEICQLLVRLLQQKVKCSMGAAQFIAYIVFIISFQYLRNKKSQFSVNISFSFLTLIEDVL